MAKGGMLAEFPHPTLRRKFQDGEEAPAPPPSNGRFELGCYANSHQNTDIGLVSASNKAPALERQTIKMVWCLEARSPGKL